MTITEVAEKKQTKIKQALKARTLFNLFSRIPKIFNGTLVGYNFQQK